MAQVKVQFNRGVEGATNIVDAGTEGTKVASGTTAQRGSTTGQFRFNTTTGLAEYYTGTGFKAIDIAPLITSVNNSNITQTQIDAGFDLVITGTNFASGATVKFIGNDGTEYTSPTVTVNSETQITARVNTNLDATKEPFDVQVTSVGGLASTGSDLFNINSSPAFTTASGSLGTVVEDVAVTATLNAGATDPEGSSVTHSITSSSLPTGLSIASATGLITGTPNVNDAYASGGVTHNFTVSATDGTNTSTRAFSILRKFADGSTATQAATSAKAIKTLTNTTTSGLYWLKPSGFSYPAQFYCEMNYYGGGWTYIYQQQVVNSAGLSWTNSYQGSQNDASSAFRGVQDNNGTNHTPQEIWNGIVGSSNDGAVYCKETQTSGGSYVERQAYTNSSDNGIFTYSEFLRLFAGNFADDPTGVKVHFNNGNSTVTGKEVETWGNLATINNGQVDQELYYCNGNGNDGNWSFGLMKGGTPYPGGANSANGGSRSSITRWATFAIRED